nr:GntR family transcriptional regulator [Haloferax mucosum]
MAELRDCPRDKRALADDLDVSRSTVNRALRNLVDAGVVKRRGNVYETTLTGRAALDAFNQCVRSLRGIVTARDLLSMLPPDAPLDPVFFSGATVHTSTPQIPDSVMQRLFGSIEDADCLYGVAPVALAGQLRPFYETATAGGTTVEMILSNELFEKLVDTPDSRAVIAEQLRRETVTIYRTDVPFGFGLWTVGDEAGIVVYTDTGVGGIARNDEDDAVSWAKAQFDSLREEATLVTDAALDGDE